MRHLSRHISIFLLISLFSFCTNPKSNTVTTSKHPISKQNVTNDTLIINLKPIKIYGYAPKYIKAAFDTIHITVDQAETFLSSLYSKAIKQYKEVSRIPDSSLRSVINHKITLTKAQLDYLKNPRPRRELYSSFISDSFIKHSLRLPDSLILSQKRPYIWNSVSPVDADLIKFHETHTQIQFFSLLDTSFSLDLFAVALGYPASWFNHVLFFKKNKLLGYKKIEHHYGMEITGLKATIIDGDTIVCFKENYESGTGIWWYEYLFYLIKNDSLIPIQNIISEANFAISPSIPYTSYLKLEILNCNPLKFKTHYYFTILLPTHYPQPYKFILNDTIVLTYYWNKNLRKFIPSAENKLDTLQLYAFVPGFFSNYLLVYAFRKELIKCLHQDNCKNWVLWFLQTTFRDEIK